MRSVICDDETFARLIGEGALCDYELGERYVVAPAAAGAQAVLQAEIIAALRGALEGGSTWPEALQAVRDALARWHDEQAQR